MTTTRVLLAGGGTAGHVFPALAVAGELAAAGVEPVFAGVADRLEADLVPAAGYRLHHVEAVAVPRRPSLALLRLPGALRSAVAQCEAIAKEEEVAGVLTFGGYVSFPVARAAHKLGLPLVIHEQNAVPGLANKVASRWADRIAVSVPGSADRFPRAERCAVTGNPVRQEVLDLDRAARRAQARAAFDLDPDLPTLLVFGGSQGARSLNHAITGAHTRWSTDRLQILHAAGRSQFSDAATRWERARATGKGPPSRVVDFIDSMADAYAAADVVVCRAGATSIAELTVLGLPAVLVPYPHATGDHQHHNAAALERAGGAVLVDDDEMDAARLVAEVEPLLTDPVRHAAVADAARSFGRRDAAHNVAQLLLDRIA